MPNIYATDYRKRAMLASEKDYWERMARLVTYLINVLQGVCAHLFSCVQLFATPWAVTASLLCPRDFPGKNTEEGCHSLLWGIFLTLGSNAFPAPAGRFFTKPPGQWLMNLGITFSTRQVICITIR